MYRFLPVLGAPVGRQRPRDVPGLGVRRPGGQRGAVVEKELKRVERRGCCGLCSQAPWPPPWSPDESFQASGGRVSRGSFSPAFRKERRGQDTLPTPALSLVPLAQNNPKPSGGFWGGVSCPPSVSVCN